MVEAVKRSCNAECEKKCRKVWNNIIRSRLLRCWKFYETKGRITTTPRLSSTKPIDLNLRYMVHITLNAAFLRLTLRDSINRKETQRKFSASLQQSFCSHAYKSSNVVVEKWLRGVSRAYRTKFLGKRRALFVDFIETVINKFLTRFQDRRRA